MKKREDWGPADEFIGETIPAAIVGTVISVPIWLPLLWFVIDPLTRWLNAAGLPTLASVVGLVAMLTCMTAVVFGLGHLGRAENTKDQKEEKKPDDSSTK